MKNIDHAYKQNNVILYQIHSYILKSKNLSIVVFHN